MRRFCIGIAGAALAVPILLTSCGTQPDQGLENVKSVRSISAHYVLVEFSQPASKAAESPSSYRILDPQRRPLAVEGVELDADRMQATLTTERQGNVHYTLQLSDPDLNLISVGSAVPADLVDPWVFLGSPAGEPFLESAVSLSDTAVLLTFSKQMDPETAENILYYEIADPDGNTDIDIRVTDAQIQPDFTTVILTTTPQENIQYSIRVTNVQRRFTCEDEGRIFIDDAAQGTSCASNFRPTNADGELTSFVLTSRTKIDTGARLDPDATGVGGSVGLEANGAGVRRPLCNGGTTGIDGGNGSDPDEELIFTADRAELAERVVLGVRQMDFASDQPVLFISSEVADGFDFVFDTAAIQAAFNTGVEAGDIVFASLPLPAGLMIDAVKLRETHGAIWVNSVCGLSISRRLIDPTRNKAKFWGIPPVDNAGPRVVRAESISDTQVIVSFSEPLNSEAADPSHFSISPDLTVIDARMTKYDTQIILTTSPQRVDVIYTVTVSDVRDKAGNLIDPAANTADFSYVGGPASLGADALPRVVGAASLGNTSVLVTFNKPMGPSAEVAGNYIIVQESVNPEVGAIGVISAAFLSPQQDAVELTTTSQNEVIYVLTAVNVRDLSGNQLAPPQLLVEPSVAIFAGTPFSCGGNPCDPPDSDGDTIPDAVELRGYVVTVQLSNGEIDQREVTSDMNSPDTDGDGLGDATERRSVSDPRNPDTDGDQLPDFEEFNFVFSSMTKQDTDGDGISDQREVNFFKTNANLADSDGDGFDDAAELFEMNRDPRIADLPQPSMSIGAIDLRLEEQFSFTDEEGVAHTEDSSTASTLTASRTRTVSSSTETTFGLNIKGSFEAGIEGPPLKVHAKGGVEAGVNFGLAFQSSRESSVQTTNAFEQSMSKGFSIAGSTSFTRNVVGGRIDALVSLGNLSDVAFSLSNLEITVSAPNPDDRSSFVPVATLIPNTTLITGDSATYNIGVLDGNGRGPIMFTSRDVFPALVEDLMRDPRGLLFEFANFDLTDEFGRNFAFGSQAARDRTVGLVIDFGDGDLQRFLVASAPVRNREGNIVGGFAGVPGTCTNPADDGDECLDDSDCSDVVDACVGRIEPFGGIGPVPPLPLEYILEEVLFIQHNTVEVPAIWSAEASERPLVERDEEGEIVAADAILVGPNGTADSVAQGDDVQRIPFGIDGLPDDAVVIDAGEDGILQSQNRDADGDNTVDDVLGVVTGYATVKTCGPDTPSSIRPGPNGVVDTVRDPFSDDDQLVPFGTDGVALATDIIGPGTPPDNNGFIDTAPAGDDVFVGPGVPCSTDADCPGAGLCDGQERLFRFKQRENGQFGRFWAVLTPNENLLGVDFRKTVLRPGDLLFLAFIQDLDRDGLISDVEFLFGSSDTRQDTDGDLLDDFAEIRVGWEVGVEGEALRRVFPDPRLPDSDGDGLSDREEQDMRRVQCECVNGPDIGEACTRDIGAADPEEREACRTGTSSCTNVADSQNTACSKILTDNRLDPRRRDTDGDLVSDTDEVLGWLTQAAVIDPKHVIIAGSDRDADTMACPLDVCDGGSNDGEPCRYQRDCPPAKECDGGINDSDSCDNDIDCRGPTPATSGLCNDPGDSHVCNRTGCDDVQVVVVGDVGLDERAVVVAPGLNGALETLAAGGDELVGAGDLLAQTSALGDDQQIALVDPARVLEDTPLGRTIIRPGVDGVIDSLPTSNDVVAQGQFLKSTNPLSPDTDRDQISEGLERILGSDPRDPTDGGFLADKDGDGLTDGQEEVVGWIVRANGDPVGVGVHSNPNAPDSDLDGLPDFAEFLLRTNPNDEDTDSDGLSDFDELSEDQFTEFEEFNDIFPGYFLDGSTSAMYGTDPLDCDSDGDDLTDDFEVLVGWDVTVVTDDGVDVFHVFTDPTNGDTDFDGLDDGAEYKHTFEGPLAPPTDPTDFDSDGDGRTDGEECTNQPAAPALAACTDPVGQSLATCASDPLVPDRKVTIRYVQMTVASGDEGGAHDTVDLAWRFQAKKSDEAFPGSWFGVRTERGACLAASPDGWCSEGGYCSVPEGTDFIFQGPHCFFNGGPCTSDAECTGLVGTCSWFGFPCSQNTHCPLFFLGETCGNLVSETCSGSNEQTYFLQPGEGILLNGEASQFDSCRTATCTSGSNAGDPCNPGGFESQCCPKFCTGGNTSCTSNDDCTDPDTCDFNCAGINCEAPAPQHHVIYLKELSFETLRDGYSVDIARMTDADGDEQFSITLVTEILVE